MTAPTLADVLLAQLDDRGLQALAERLQPFLAQSLASRFESPPDAWLDTKRAAGYLGLTVTALHKMTAARTIPFEQDGPRCKCWFKRSELDE